MTYKKNKVFIIIIIVAVGNNNRIHSTHSTIVKYEYIFCKQIMYNVRYHNIYFIKLFNNCVSYIHIQFNLIHNGFTREVCFEI